MPLRDCLSKNPSISLNILHEVPLLYSIYITHWLFQTKLSAPSNLLHVIFRTGAFYWALYHKIRQLTKTKGIHPQVLVSLNILRSALFIRCRLPIIIHSSFAKPDFVYFREKKRSTGILHLLHLWYTLSGDYSKLDLLFCPFLENNERTTSRLALCTHRHNFNRQCWKTIVVEIKMVIVMGFWLWKDKYSMVKI